MILDLLAQATPLIGDKGLGIAGASIGAGLATLGSGLGIGRIGTNMIISAALIEGFTFFALVICLLASGKFG
jgi:F-type H+-transporting ATPase subunit c